MKRRASAGFSLIEMLVVIAIVGVLAAMAIPGFMNSMNSYRFSGAVAASTGAIQSTRFQAIMQGYPYRLVFTSSTLSYQVSNQVPPATSFSAVGSAIPIARPGDATFNGTTFTYTFSPNGTVTSSSTMQISNGVSSNTLTVSGVGNVTVTSP